MNGRAGRKGQVRARKNPLREIDTGHPKEGRGHDLSHLPQRKIEGGG